MKQYKLLQIKTMENKQLMTESSEQVGPVRDFYKIETEKVVIADECGDTLWDEVLEENERKVLNTEADQ